MAMESVTISEAKMRKLGFEGDYARGDKLFTQDKLTTVTRDDDPEWSDFVNMIVMSMTAAESRNITRSTAHLFGQTDLFGGEYTNMFVDALGVIGNYDELYFSVFAHYLDRKGWNLMNNGTLPMMSAPTIVSAQEDGPGPIYGGTLERILERGVLQCAIRANRTGFAHYPQGDNNAIGVSNATYNASDFVVQLAGLDAEYCRALSTSIFEGSTSNVVMVEIDSEAEGFQKLGSGEVDVLAGATWTLQNDVREPTTGQGFSFSQPYFYRPVGYERDNR